MTAEPTDLNAVAERESRLADVLLTEWKLSMFEQGATMGKDGRISGPPEFRIEALRLARAALRAIDERGAG